MLYVPSGRELSGPRTNVAIDLVIEVVVIPDVLATLPCQGEQYLKLQRQRLVMA